MPVMAYCDATFRAVDAVIGEPLPGTWNSPLSRNLKETELKGAPGPGGPVFLRFVGEAMHVDT